MARLPEEIDRGARAGGLITGLASMPGRLRIRRRAPRAWRWPFSGNCRSGPSHSHADCGETFGRPWRRRRHFHRVGWEKEV